MVKLRMSTPAVIFIRYSTVYPLSTLSNDYVHQINNKNHYFSTLANITNIIIPGLAKEDRQFSRGFPNSTAFPVEDSRAPKIRQILDNIQISSGYQTRINSSSLLLPIINNSDGHLVANDVTFALSSTRSPLFSVTNFSDENVINYELKKNAKIRNLKMYGSYEVIVESSDSDKLTSPSVSVFL